MVLFKTKTKIFKGNIQTVFLFGVIPLYKKLVTPEVIKYYFAGIKVRAIRTKEKARVFHYAEDAWYSLLDHNEQIDNPPTSEPNVIPNPLPGTCIQMDIDRALALMPNIDRIAIVFFMGIGDYFFSTRFIDKLKKRYPNIPFTAYVSKNSDINNSPLVAECCRTNPCFDEVKLYDGHANKYNWKNYDYSDVVREEPKTTLILPMIYEHDDTILSRDDTLCDTFHLPLEKLAKKPYLYDWKMNQTVVDTANEIEEIVRKEGLKGVVWMTMNARSASFAYKYSAELIRKVTEEGYYVVCVDPVETVDPHCMIINCEKFRITDSIALLRLLKQKMQTYCFTMASCFCSISSALDIPNLCVQFFYDTSLATVYFPNIFIVTHRKYICVPREKQFLSSENDYDIDGFKAQYHSDYLIECFNYMLKRLEEEKK
ncbi:MAG: hypothetical protein PHQ75_04770 [Thermoguttaceae bacterium]|nr:hypothetical protein [Thermoguttaceae bacterium]